MDDSQITFLSDWLNISHTIRSDRGYRWSSRFVFCSVLERGAKKGFRDCEK